MSLKIFLFEEVFLFQNEWNERPSRFEIDATKKRFVAKRVKR